jgi:cytochrome c-type biogenesis protein CcmH/NrfF
MALLWTVVIVVVVFGGGLWALSRSRFVRMRRKPDGTMTDEERRAMQAGIGLTGSGGGAPGL